MAFQRYHGGSHEHQLGYFFGDNAFATIAVDVTGLAPFFASGVVAPLAEFKRVHGLADTQNISILPEVNRTFTGVTAAGAKGTTVALTDDDAYVIAYASQENFKRIVDTVQQRAVIAATSAELEQEITLSDLFLNDVGVNSAATGIGSASTISFLVERANVFNRDGIDVYGQPTGIVAEGRNLQEALNGIALLSPTASDVQLVPVTAADSSTTAGNYGVKMIGIPGSANAWTPVK